MEVLLIIPIEIGLDADPFPRELVANTDTDITSADEHRESLTLSISLQTPPEHDKGTTVDIMHTVSDVEFL